MKIYGISVVQNESDVIADSVRWASRFCERIWVWDLGSTDETWERLQGLELPNVAVEQRQRTAFVNSIRGTLYAEVKHRIEEGAWIYILDADEFLVSDPRPTLAAAEREDAVVVGAWQVNFFPTRDDLASLEAMGETAWTSIPLSERLRHYRVEWLEHRFVRVVPGLVWDTSTPFNRWTHADGTKLRISRHTTLVRHYRCRSPRQILIRHRTRYAGELWNIGQFRWTPSADFSFYIQPPRRVRHWPPGSGEISISPYEMLRARAVWLSARMQKAIRRRFWH